MTDVDGIGLPEFSHELPTKQSNWGVKLYGDQEEAEKLLRRLGSLVDAGLTPRDLILS